MIALPQSAARIQVATRTLAAARTTATRPAALFTYAHGTYIEVPNSAALNVTGNISFMCWVKPLLGAYLGNANWIGVGFVAIYGDDSVATWIGGGPTSGWLMDLATYGSANGFTNQIQPAVLNSTQAGYENTGGLGPGIDLMDGKWHQVGFAYNQSLQELYPYVDGRHITTGTAIPPWTATTYPLRIGRYFQGAIADVVVYNDTLLPTSAFASVYAGAPPPSGCTARWLLNEGSGTTAHDSGPNGLDGTLTNGVQWGMPAPAR